jgi:hypothetical protein
MKRRMCIYLQKTTCMYNEEACLLILDKNHVLSKLVFRPRVRNLRRYANATDRFETLSQTTHFEGWLTYAP